MLEVKTIARTEEELRTEIFNLFTALTIGAKVEPILLETYTDENFNAYHLIGRAEYNEEDGQKGLIIAATLQADAFDLEGTTIGILRRELYFTDIDAEEVYSCFQKAIKRQRETIQADAEAFDWSL